MDLVKLYAETNTKVLAKSKTDKSIQINDRFIRVTTALNGMNDSFQKLVCQIVQHNEFPVEMTLGEYYEDG